MYGVITSTGGSTTIAGRAIGTAGSQAFAVLTANGGSATISNSLIGPTVITTTGTSGNAIDVSSGGSTQITGAQIMTNADGAAGLVVTGAASSLTATGVSVTTKGGIDSVTGQYANGAYNGPGSSDASGGSLNLTNSTIAANGFNSSAS
jgi:autotransporter family porin